MVLSGLTTGSWVKSTFETTGVPAASMMEAVAASKAPTGMLCSSVTENVPSALGTIKKICVPAMSIQQL